MFALIVSSLQVKSGKDTMTESGERFLVMVEPEGWVPATSSLYKGEIYGGAKLFETAEAAEDFAKTWRGHPWWVKPGKKFEVIEVRQKFKKVPDGYEPIKKARK